MKPHEFGVFLSKLGLEDDIRLPDDHLEVSYRATPSYHPLLFGIFHYKPSIFGEHPIKMDDFFFFWHPLFVEVSIFQIWL